MVKILLGLLIILVAYFAFVFVKDYIGAKREGKLEKTNSIVLGISGFVALFCDTLGVGSFAILTTVLKNFKLSADRTLPGTLNVSCTIPVLFEALIFVTVIKVEPVTLVAMLISATVGAVAGASIVSRLDEKKVQVGMGAALIVIAVIMVLGQLNMIPAGGNAIGLNGIKIIIAVIGNFILGSLMTLGIGLYAPCMALVYALGMSPKVAFPIMMCSCAFLLPSASVKFIKEEAYDRQASMMIAIFGIVGVLVAAYIVKELPLSILKWLVVVVLIYTSINMFKSAHSKVNA